MLDLSFFLDEVLAVSLVWEELELASTASGRDGSMPDAGTWLVVDSWGMGISLDTVSASSPCAPDDEADNGTGAAVGGGLLGAHLGFSSKPGTDPSSKRTLFERTVFDSFACSKTPPPLSLVDLAPIHLQK